MVAARASTGAAPENPRQPPGAADCANGRRQDTRRILADAGGVVFLIPSAFFTPPSAKRRGPRRAKLPLEVGGGWWLSEFALSCGHRVCRNTTSRIPRPHPGPPPHPPPARGAA